MEIYPICRTMGFCLVSIPLANPNPTRVRIWSWIDDTRPCLSLNTRSLHRHCQCACSHDGFESRRPSASIINNVRRLMGALGASGPLPHLALLVQRQPGPCCCPFPLSGRTLVRKHAPQPLRLGSSAAWRWKSSVGVGSSLPKSDTLETLTSSSLCFEIENAAQRADDEHEYCLWR